MNKFLCKIAKDKIHPHDKELIDFVTDPTMPDDSQYMVFPEHKGKYGKLSKEILKQYVKEFGKGTEGIISTEGDGNYNRWVWGSDGKLKSAELPEDSETLRQLLKLKKSFGGAPVGLEYDNKHGGNLSIFPQIYDYRIGAETPDDYDFSELANVALAKAPKKFDKLHLKHRWYGKDADDFGVDSYAVVGGKRVPLDISEKDLDKYENTMRRLRLRQKFKKLNYSIDPEGNYEAEYKY